MKTGVESGGSDEASYSTGGVQSGFASLSKGLDAEGSMDVLDRTTRMAISEALGSIREVERTQGISRPTLERIAPILTALAASRKVHFADAFPMLEANTFGRQLSVDADDRFALYLVSEESGATSPPHEHMTWTVIASIRGEELHRLYRRREDVSSDRHVGRIRECTLKPGTYLAMMSDEIHSTQVLSQISTLHLQIYGLDLTRMPEFCTRTFLDAHGNDPQTGEP